MTLPPSASPSNFPHIIKTILYVMAWIILVLGLIAGISLMVSTSTIVSNAVIPFSIFGNQAIPNLIAPILTSFLINLGVVILIVAVALSALLYAIGRLLNHITQLEERLARLEARVRQTT